MVQDVVKTLLRAVGSALYKRLEMKSMRVVTGDSSIKPGQLRPGTNSITCGTMGEQKMAFQRLDYVGITGFEPVTPTLSR